MAAARDVGSFDHTFKILLVGDAAVGKSSLLLRFTEHVFEQDMQSTIGVDFKVKAMDIGGKRCKVCTVVDVFADYLQSPQTRFAPVLRRLQYGTQLDKSASER